jgi:putative ABC transport system permease protein
MIRLAIRLWGWLRALVGRDLTEREMQGEMALHLERATERLITRGMTPDAARAQARREFGNVGVIQEEARDARGVRWLHELWDDARYSARALAHAPVYTISAALVLALGIGTSTAVFSAVDAVLLAHLPYPRDEQLVRIFEQNPTNRWTLSVVDYQAIERYARSFTAVGALRGGDVSIVTGGNVERHPAGYMTAGFLDALGVDVAVGRRLSAADERPDAAAVTIITDRFATGAFGSARAALDQVVTVDGRAHRVVGILAPGVRRLAIMSADVWPVLQRTIPQRRGPNGLYVIGRVRDGLTIEAAQRDLAAVSVRIFPDWQTSMQDSTARLTPYSLRETIVGRAARPLALFSAAVALVLLIAVSNVASLSIVRCMRRWREISLRAVLGASRGRLVRLILTESVILSALAGALGLAIGWIGLILLQRFADGMPRLAEAHIDGRAALVAAMVSIIAGVAIGVVPATRLLSTERRHQLRDGTRSVGDGKQSDAVRALFVAAEFALALPVLAAGALLLTSFQRLTRVDPGFDAHELFTTRVGVPSVSCQNGAACARFWTNVVNGVGELSGVTAAALSTAIPPNDDGNNNNNYDLVDSPVPPGGAQSSVTWPAVSTNFFSTLHIPLLEGRLFTFADTGGSRPVVVVTRSWAKHYYPGRSALGREMISGGCTSCPHTVIVGIVGDVTYDGLGTPREAIFSPLTEGWPRQLYMFVRSSAPGPAIVQRVRDAVRAADPSAAIESMKPMEDEIYESLAQPRHWATILIAFAGAALLLAAVGIFGLLSYAVALRRREIGVRMALGAPAGKVIGWLIAGGLRYAIIGSVIGIALTTIASRWLRASLYDVSAVDPPTLLGVTVGLLAVAMLASWLPARRAATIDPIEAMRPE